MQESRWGELWRVWKVPFLHGGGRHLLYRRFWRMCTCSAQCFWSYFLSFFVRVSRFKFEHKHILMRQIFDRIKTTHAKSSILGQSDGTNQYGTNSVLLRDDFTQPTSNPVSKTFKPMSLKHSLTSNKKKLLGFFSPLFFFSRSNCSKCFPKRMALHTWSVWTHQDKFQPPTFCFKYKNQTQKKTKKNKTKKLATVSGFLAAACLWHLCPSFERACKLIAWRVWAKPQKT